MDWSWMINMGIVINIIGIKSSMYYFLKDIIIFICCFRVWKISKSIWIVFCFNFVKFWWNKC